MKIAVTGGSGELGRNLIPYLLEQGHSVVSIDRSLPPVPDPVPARRPEYVVADTRNFGEVVASTRGCDALIHLAAHRTPLNHPDSVVYVENTASSYNALSAAATLGIKRVCLASSINAIGSTFSRSPRYDYFPLDEQHPTYAEDPYGLSKWVLEQQADAFARRYECPLCEEMAAVVAAVGAEVPLQVTAVDIAGDPELLRRFGHEVPVLFVDGRKAFKYRVAAGSLRRRIWRAQWERRMFGPPPEMPGGGT